MVEAEVVDTATETNGYSHSEPITDKLTTVGEEKKVSFLIEICIQGGLSESGRLNYPL